MREKNLLEHYVQDRTSWRRLAMNSDPIQNGINNAEEKEEEECVLFLVFWLSRFHLLSLLLFTCFCFHSGFPSSSSSVSSFVPAPSSLFSSSSFPSPIFLLPLSAFLCSSSYFLVSFSPFFSPCCCFFSSAGFPLLHSLCSAFSAPSLVDFLLLFSFSFVSFSSSPSLSFPPSSSFPPSLLIFPPDFLYHFLFYVFFSSFLCSSSFVFFGFLGSFFFFTSSVGLFFLPSVASSFLGHLLTLLLFPPFLEQPLGVRLQCSRPFPLGVFSFPLSGVSVWALLWLRVLYFSC